MFIDCFWIVQGESKPVVEVWNQSSLLAVVGLDEATARSWATRDSGKKTCSAEEHGEIDRDYALHSLKATTWMSIKTLNSASRRPSPLSSLSHQRLYKELMLN
jgi:hypothetical protein